MARRKKGDPVDGWLIVDKPLGVSSTDVVGRVRWAFNARKAGHAGTLDPLATGVVAVALGEATKTIPYIADAQKAYRFTARWGVVTESADAEGAVTETSALRPSEEEIRAALPRFTGDIMQVPPIYSAVKVDGKRAYDLARAGENPELKARPLHVAALSLLARPDPDHAEFEMTCGKGGYVRSIARDLGAALGCGAHVSALRRIWSGPFTAADALSLEQVQALRDDPARDSRLAPVQAGLHGVPERPVDAAAAAHLRQGRAAPSPGGDAWGTVVWASHAGQPVAIGVVKAGLLHPGRVFA